MYSLFPELTCDRGMVYQECGTSCGKTCRLDLEPTNCVEECVEGCSCIPVGLLQHMTMSPCPFFYSILRSLSTDLI